MRLTGRAFPNGKLWFSGSLFFLMIRFFCIHTPDMLLIRTSRQKEIHCTKCCHHRMIHVIVAMLSIPSDTEQIFDFIQPCSQFTHPVIDAKISWVCFLYFLDMKIKNFQKTKSIIYHISRQKHPQKASADRPVSLFFFHDNTQPSSHSSHCSANSCFTGYPDSTG